VKTLRAADVVLSAIGILAASPILALAALAVHLDSEGSAIFAQRRVGRNGKAFTCYKLRTMTLGTSQGASHEVGSSTITRVGRVLRRSKIDELPQLWNVLRGDMSLVGPRPCMPGMSELIAERQCRGVDALRPGITGPAQIAGIDMSEPRKLAAADAVWLRQASLTAYFRILVATAVGHGWGDAASS
jgi:O-antigen biosynthesis protein WbqP